MRIAKHLRITGLVQGVGYRAGFRAKAVSLGLSGWVRNRIDTSVEAAVSGNEAEIEKMIDWARRGPPSARVDEVAVADADQAEINEGRFEQLPTA